MLLNQLVKISLLLAVVLINSATAPAQELTFAERLRWPADTKVVIFHVDDVGMPYDSNMRATKAMKKHQGLTQTPLVKVVDMNVGESQTVPLHDGSQATIKLLDRNETRDDIRNAVRRAVVKVEVNGKTVSLVSSTYHLPITVAGVQIDCPVTKGYLERSSQQNVWGLIKDARLRLWPADSPWIRPGTFVYPVKQRWFASDTQMANVPVFVDGGEIPGSKDIYYHYGLDFGGAEGLVDVVSATDGLVVSAAQEKLPGYEDSPVKPRYDVIYILDEQGWFYRYSHLYKIDDFVKPGR